MQLEHRTALITGASSGIGRAIAIEAAARNMHVVLTGRRLDALEKTRSMLSPRTVDGGASDGAAADVIVADLTRAADRERIHAILAERYRRLGEIERRLELWHRNNVASRRIEEIPGVGVLSATAAVAAMGDPAAFKSGREGSYSTYDICRKRGAYRKSI